MIRRSLLVGLCVVAAAGLPPATGAEDPPIGSASLSDNAYAAWRVQLGDINQRSSQVRFDATFPEDTGRFSMAIFKANVANPHDFQLFQLDVTFDWDNPNGYVSSSVLGTDIRMGEFQTTATSASGELGSSYTGSPGPPGELDIVVIAAADKPGLTMNVDLFGIGTLVDRTEGTAFMHRERDYPAALNARTVQNGLETLTIAAGQVDRAIEGRLFAAFVHHDPIGNSSMIAVPTTNPGGFAVTGPQAPDPVRSFVTDLSAGPSPTCDPYPFCAFTHVWSLPGNIEVGWGIGGGAPGDWSFQIRHWAAAWSPEVHDMMHPPFASLLGADVRF